VLRANFVQQRTGNLWEMTAEFRNCEAMLCVFRNFITDRTSQSAGAGIRASISNSCNAATVRTQEVPLVHAPCYILALLRMRSRFAQYKVCQLWDEWETYFVDALRTNWTSALNWCNWGHFIIYCLRCSLLLLISIVPTPYLHCYHVICVKLALHTHLLLSILIFSTASAQSFM
jgi:hypothetical protein